MSLSILLLWVPLMITRVDFVVFHDVKTTHPYIFIILFLWKWPLSYKFGFFLINLIFYFLWSLGCSVCGGSRCASKWLTCKSLYVFFNGHVIVILLFFNPQVAAKFDLYQHWLHNWFLFSFLFKITNIETIAFGNIFFN